MNQISESACAISRDGLQGQPFAMEKQVIIGRSNPSGENVAIGVNARARSTYVIGITGNLAQTLTHQIF